MANTAMLANCSTVAPPLPAIFMPLRVAIRKSQAPDRSMSAANSSWSCACHGLQVQLAFVAKSVVFDRLADAFV